MLLYIHVVYTYLMSSHAHFLREKGALWTLLFTVAVVSDWVGAGVKPGTWIGAGRGACTTRDRRVDHLSTTVTSQLLVTCRHNGQM